jgi:hypothetical protein
VTAAAAADETVLRRGNVEELICYAFWHRRRGKMLAAGHGKALGRQVAALEAALGGPLPAGYNRRLRCDRARAQRPSSLLARTAAGTRRRRRHRRRNPEADSSVSARRRMMSHTWQPLRHLYRPLSFYACSEAAAALAGAALAAMGFRRHTTPTAGLGYYALRLPPPGPSRYSFSLDGGGGGRGGGPARRRASGLAIGGGGGDAAAAEGDDAPPIVFLPGVGMGLVPYLPFLAGLAATGRRIIAFEFKHVAMRWTHHIPTLARSLPSSQPGARARARSPSARAGRRRCRRSRSGAHAPASPAAAPPPALHCRRLDRTR